MINKDEKLKRVSDAIFQETNYPADRSRALEWKRSFNFVSLPIKNIQVIRSFGVHEKELTFSEEDELNPFKDIKYNSKSKIIIEGIIEEEKFRDSIYFANKSNKEEDIYSVTRNKGKTKIILKSGEPAIGSKNFPAGLYRGQAFRSNEDPSQDDLCLDLSMPEEQIKNLLTSLQLYKDTILEVGVYLLSYTFEVDDAFRSYNDSRDIIITDNTTCLISWAATTSKIDANEPINEADIEEKLEEIEILKDELPDNQPNLELLQAINNFSKPLKNLTTAIWFLIVAVFIHMAFK